MQSASARLWPLASAAASAASAAGAAASGAANALLGSSAAEAPTGEATRKSSVVLQELALTAERVQTLAGQLAERLTSARSELDGAIAPAGQVVRGLRAVGYRASQALHRFGSSTVEFLTSQGPSADSSELRSLSRELWRLWRAKHEALTAAERTYFDLLADARRSAATSVELRALRSKLAEVDEEVSPSTSQAALDQCRTAIEQQAEEAIKSFTERSKDYPCGWPHPRTGLLRIARTPAEVALILEAFKTAVLEQKQELLTQADELVLAPDLRTLTSALARRVAFWEDQIEESWLQWSTQSSCFHEAQTGAAETWDRLRSQTYRLLTALHDYLSDACRGSSTEQVYQDPFDQELHDTFAEVATMLALLGGWAHFHNLRGDGHVLTDVRELFLSILACLDTHFVQLGYEGSRSVYQQLAAESSWQLIQEAPELAPRRGMDFSDLWWLPDTWPRILPSGNTEPSTVGVNTPQFSA
mmetsp:Transcript_32360/g.72705  ORF Transcript_32360/g.72705 Transcript_32360/m.72705 type:complete len:474 (-) Transcript_32360:17-1438(-)